MSRGKKSQTDTRKSTKTKGKNGNNVTPDASDTPSTSTEAENLQSTISESVDGESQEEVTVVTNEQTLWLRNVIRAQAKDILQDMMDEKWSQIENNPTIQRMVKALIKSEVEGLAEKVSNLTIECQKKQRQIERLEHECCQKDHQIKSLRLQLDELHQQTHDRSLQVVGLPEVESVADDVKQIIKLSKEKLHIKLKSSDFEVTRLGKKKETKTRNTLLKFKDKSLRDKIFEHRKKTATNSSPRENIYFNDQLTKHRQNLLFTARNLVKSKKLFAAWAQQGNILIRKTESDKIVQVYDHDELKVITGNKGSTDSIEKLRGNSLQTSDDGLSVTTHLSDYDYYVDSDV